MFIVIDVFSKYLWVRPLKAKTQTEVALALAQIYGSSARRPQALWVDQGKEYYNKEVQAVAKKFGFSLYSVLSDIKSSVAERLIRMLKTMIYRYLHEHQTWTYINVLPDLVANYNLTLHRSIGMTPAEVRPRHTEVLLQKISPALINIKSVAPPKYPVGS